LQKSTTEFARVDDMSKSLSAFARQISFVQFKAIHPGLGLGGAVLSDFAKVHPSVADISPVSQNVSQLIAPAPQPIAANDAMTEADAGDVSPQDKKSNSSPHSRRWIAGLLGFTCDWFLAIAGILTVIGVLQTVDERFLDGIFRMIPWEKYSLWAVGLGTIFGVFLLYWLCFLLVVGGTPGKKFVKRYFSSSPRKSDLSAKPKSL